jgi:hypothetical protein
MRRIAALALITIIGTLAIASIAILWWAMS